MAPSEKEPRAAKDTLFKVIMVWSKIKYIKKVNNKAQSAVADSAGALWPRSVSDL